MTATGDHKLPFGNLPRLLMALGLDSRPKRYGPFKAVEIELGRPLA